MTTPASLLHSGYSHPVLREWQQSRTAPIQAHQLIYPVFVTDASPDAQEPIHSMPNQYR